MFSTLTGLIMWKVLVGKKKKKLKKNLSISSFIQC